MDEKFNKMMWRFNSIEPVDAALEDKLRIAFQEGSIVAQEYMIEKLRPHIEVLKQFTPHL